MKRVLALNVLLIIIASCTSFSKYQTAETLEPGTPMVGIGASLEKLVIKNKEHPLYKQYSKGLIYPFDIFIRHGIAENLDMGIKIFPVGTTIDMKIRPYHNKILHFAFSLGIALHAFTGIDEGKLNLLNVFLLNSYFFTFNLHKYINITLSFDMYFKFKNFRNSYIGSSIIFSFFKKYKLYPEFGVYFDFYKSIYIHTGLGFGVEFN